MTKPVTGDAEIRPGEKFAEDALAQTCEMQRESIRKMQTALDLQDSELWELRAARALLIQQLETANNARLERKTGWVAAMAAELTGKYLRQDDKDNFVICLEAEALERAKNLYAETEKQLGAAK